MYKDEIERLAMLAEEAGEIVQIVGKILRHGYDSYNPHSTHMVSNKELLISELQDIQGIIYGMMEQGDFDSSDLEKISPKATWKKKLKWTHHQEIAE